MEDKQRFSVEWEDRGGNLRLSYTSAYTTNEAVNLVRQVNSDFACLVWIDISDKET